MVKCKETKLQGLALQGLTLKDGVQPLRVDIMGVGFDNITVDEAVTCGYELLCGDKASYAVTPNPEMVYETFSNSEFQDILNGASLVLADGIGIIYAGKILKAELKSRVTGIAFAEGLMDMMQKSGKKLFLLGSKPGVAETARENLKKRYPELLICGVSDGYFTSSDPVINRINTSGADCVFVCLGFPKQENWMAENVDKLNAKLLVGLGGALDSFAGTVKRAPVAMQKLGLEWFYRLMKQPSRFKRMLNLPKFLFAVYKKR